MTADPLATPPGFRSVLTRPHDGDSFRILADTWFDQRYEPELRLLEVYAPEMLAVPKLPPRAMWLPGSPAARVPQPGAVETTAFVAEWFGSHAGSGLRWPWWVVTILVRAREPGQSRTFTRFLATVWPYGEQDDPHGSLNVAVAAFLAEHPEWGPGVT